MLPLPDTVQLQSTPMPVETVVEPVSTAPMDKMKVPDPHRVRPAPKPGATR